MTVQSPVKPATASPDMLSDYRVQDGRFDELLQGKSIRSHYATLMEDICQQGPLEMRRKKEISQRILREHGVTYNVYGNPSGLDRPWQMDPLPLVISSREWDLIEKAVVQRATLINQILRDCYGPQKLIRTGKFPAALLFAQPNFMRPCHGIKALKDIHLHLYAVDIARSPDGQWWVTSDRTQIPTGMGYALENRLISSRVLPATYRDCQVRRLAGFFQTLQKTLASFAIHNPENPRVVLLTPGPYNETYFEQAYLARYLGYTLVEGEDLVVQSDHVFLKTLGGLQPVDVILRRVDDDYCDPLELMNESLLGVPGLVHSARFGKVTVANFLGSGLAEAPALMAFFPGLCRELLGEDLLMPSVATWWCGQKGARSYVEDHLPNLVIKSAFRSRRREIYFGEELDPAGCREIMEKIKLQPHAYIGQERVMLSSAPAWVENRIEAIPMSVRVYLVANEEGGYTVMPGGLTRATPSMQSPFLSMQRGGFSKDTWVLNDEPVEPVTLLNNPSQRIEIRRVGNNLSSRIAHHLFWLGRYAERAEISSRLLRSTLLRFSPENIMSDSPLLWPLFNTLSYHQLIEIFPADLDFTESQEYLEKQLLNALYSTSHPGSVRSTVLHLVRIGNQLRDRISGDTWRVLSHLDDSLASQSEVSTTPLGDSLNVLTRLLLDLAAFHGLSTENMTRAPGWHFMDMGHRIERSLHLCALLRTVISSENAENPSLLEALLEIADSTITYHSRYTLVPQLAAVCDLLSMDGTNPRSLLFQLQSLSHHFQKLPERGDSHPAESTYKKMKDAMEDLQISDPNELVSLSPQLRPESDFGKKILRVEEVMKEISDALMINYFTHSTMVQINREVTVNGNVSFCNLDTHLQSSPPHQPDI